MTDQALRIELRLRLRLVRADDRRHRRDQAVTHKWEKFLRRGKRRPVMADSYASE